MSFFICDLARFGGRMGCLADRSTTSGLSASVERCSCYKEHGSDCKRGDNGEHSDVILTHFQQVALITGRRRIDAIIPAGI